VDNESISGHELLILAETSLVSAAAVRLGCGTAGGDDAKSSPPRPPARLLWATRVRDRAPTYRTIVDVDVAGD
jgi:hypothetical protein